MSQESNMNDNEVVENISNKVINSKESNSINASLIYFNFKFTE